MKNPRNYYFVFGASVCVGVATIYYFYRRRCKEEDLNSEASIEAVKAANAYAVKKTDQSQSPRDSSERGEVLIAQNGALSDDQTADVFTKEGASKKHGLASKPAPAHAAVQNSVIPPQSSSAPSDANAGGVSPMQIAETLMRLSKPGSLAQLTMEDANVLKYTLSFVHGKELARILETIAQAACFNVNLPILSASGCFSRTQQLLRQAAEDRRFCPESVKISLLHALTNLSASDEHQQALKTSVDDLFSLSEGQEESLVGVACLCVVANLSLTKYCHSEIAAYSSRLFELLEDEDTALLKQVLTILLNLCCERSTVPMLLTAKAPSEMGTFVAQTGTIGTNTDLLIKWLRILRNLYKAIREDCITQESLGFTAKNSADGTVFNELQTLRLHMKACVFLLCHNKESHGLAAGAKMLYEYLEVIE